MNNNNNFDSNSGGFGGFGNSDNSGDIFGENQQANGSVFQDTGKDESNMFVGEAVPITTEKKNKKKGKLFIILAIIVVILAGAFIASPLLFIHLGDSNLNSGNYDQAITYYNLCFGVADGTNRRVAAESFKMLNEGNPEDSIRNLLENGFSVAINYDLNGGEFINSSRSPSVTLTDKTQFGDLYKAKKEFYTFDGWDLSHIDYSPAFDDKSLVLSFTANFNLNEYSISYTGLFSDKIENPEKYNHETDTITLKNPKREGYTFLYWTGTDIDSRSTTVIIPQGSHGDRAYVANWEANKYTVTMNPDVECEIENPVTVTYDSSYELPSVEKRGYTHKGWSDGKNTFFKGVWSTANDVTVTPIWEIINYKLVYNLNGGLLGTDNPATYTVISEDIALNEPTRHGYTFQGWTFNDNLYPTKNVVIANNTIGDINFNAVWRGNPHTVTFDANGGYANFASMGVVFGDNFTLPMPSKTGYSFTGWYNGNNKYENGNWQQDNDVNLTATWTANKYTATLNLNGGQGAGSSISTTYDSQYTLPTPTRYGYTFLGWYNGNEKINNSGTWRIASNVTLNAKWQGNPHKITLNANGGTIASTTVNVTVGNTYAIPNPVKKGHTFIGWYESNTKLASGGTWDKDRDVSLTASWTVNTYEATLNANGGSVNKSSVSCKYGAYYSLPTPTKDGYKFLGWYSSTEKVSNSGTWTWDSNVSLTALWEALDYVIYLDANGGEVSTTKISVTYDSRFNLPEPKRKGYIFIGWFSGGREYDSGVWKTAKNVTLEASWELRTYKATFDLDGGKADRKYISCKYGASYSLPTPTREGYTFDGWYNNNESRRMSNSGTWTWDEDLLITALWEPLEYTVYFDANGGNVSTRQVKVKYNGKYTFPKPTRDGYEFIGWHYNGDYFKLDGRWSIAKDVTLKAEWELKQYTLLFDANGGSVKSTRMKVSLNSSYTLPTPTRKGHTFIGWYFGSTKIPESGRWSWEEDMSLEARWEPTEYMVTLNANGGTLSTTRIYVVYEDSYELPIPQKEGFVFAGWYSGNTRFGTTGKWLTTSDVTLTAKWVTQ